MLIEFNPYITDAFVKVIINDPLVNPFYDAAENDLGEEKAFELAKKIIIAAMTRYEININDLLIHLKEKR